MEERRDNENNKKIGFKDRGERAVVVAQLVEQSLATRGARGSNPVIGKKFIEQSLLSTVLKRQKERRKKKRPGMAHFLNNEEYFVYSSLVEKIDVVIN